MYTYYSVPRLVKSNRPIERALLKYGFSNFSLEILEYCDRDNVLQKEQYYLDLLKPVYNIVEKAGSTLGYRHTEETLRKMKEHVLSNEMLRIKALSTKNATEARSIGVIVENVKTKDKKEFCSMRAASRYLRVAPSSVSQAVLSNRLLKNTYLITKKITNL